MTRLIWSTSRAFGLHVSDECLPQMNAGGLQVCYELQQWFRQLPDRWQEKEARQQHCDAGSHWCLPWVHAQGLSLPRVLARMVSFWRSTLRPLAPLHLHVLAHLLGRTPLRGAPLCLSPRGCQLHLIEEQARRWVCFCSVQTWGTRFWNAVADDCLVTTFPGAQHLSSTHIKKKILTWFFYCLWERRESKENQTWSLLSEYSCSN